MGFLSWLANNPKEEAPTELQLSLWEESQPSRKRRRVDGVTVRNNFTQTIKDKGGDAGCYQDSTEALTQEVLGCETRKLYKETGAKRGDRSTLPERAQEALMTGEIVATHDLKRKPISGTQQQRNEQIVTSVSDSAKRTRKLFPW